ncbi:MAG: hypothetical protein NXY57DRAFT_904689 [Lentinula lateritia]|nr:MAG: hypothetical protein NXY57DRAFT_904689 [Lentinula lateritia]
MIHNPFTVSCFREIQEDLSTSSQSQDPYSHFRGSLQCHCVDHNVYNETTCKEAYSTLPECPEALDYALESENSTPKHRFAAIELCAKVGKGNTNGIALKDIRLKCRPDDVDSCYPEFKWVRELFNERKTKTMLGVPEYVNHTSLNMDVGKAFSEYGDKCVFSLPEIYIQDNSNAIDYVGAQDANCAWPGVLSFLKLINRPFQPSFIKSKETPWPVTSQFERDFVRQVGDGAGNMTFVLVEGADHFVRRTRFLGRMTSTYHCEIYHRA